MLCDPWALPELYEERCTLCGLCEVACPQHGIRMGERAPVFEGRERCDACGTCEDVCPTGAIVTRFQITHPDADERESGGKHDT